MGPDKDMAVNIVPWKNPCRKKWEWKERRRNERTKRGDVYAATIRLRTRHLLLDAPSASVEFLVIIHYY